MSANYNRSKSTIVQIEVLGGTGFSTWGLRDLKFDGVGPDFLSVATWYSRKRGEDDWFLQIRRWVGKCLARNLPGLKVQKVFCGASETATTGKTTFHWSTETMCNPVQN